MSVRVRDNDALVQLQAISISDLSQWINHTEAARRLGIPGSALKDLRIDGRLWGVVSRDTNTNKLMSRPSCAKTRLGWLYDPQCIDQMREFFDRMREWCELNPEDADTLLDRS